MRRHLAAIALLSTVASPLPASAAEVVIDYDDTYTYAISDENDFKPALVLLGYDRYTTINAVLTLDVESAIDFYFLGSESGYEDSFGAGVISLTELLNTDNFPAGAYIGSKLFSAGNLAGQMAFNSNIGAPAGIGDAGFGIFLKEGFTSGGAVTRFIIGYDDQVTNPDDDNHDDLMILAVVRAVPEPGTWATLLFGFGALGAAMRRKSKALRIRPTYA